MRIKGEDRGGWFDLDVSANAEGNILVRRGGGEVARGLLLEDCRHAFLRERGTSRAEAEESSGYRGVSLQVGK